MNVALSRRERRRLQVGLLFASPWILGFLGFTIIPIVSSFYLSMTVDTKLGQPLRWVGLANYQGLINDHLFWTSLSNTLYMVALGVPFNLALAIACAFLLNLKLRGIALYRTIYYLPSIVPVVATSLLWLWIFNPDFGLIDSVLNLIGLRGPGWLTDAALAKPALILMGTWGIGGAVVIFLAGLQDVPQHLHEAAMIDGAGALGRAWHITLPMLSPIILFNGIIAVIGGFQIFTQAFIMTGGGPLDATYFYALYLYNNAFVYFRVSYASAMAWILFVVVLVVTLLLFRTSARFVYYEGEEHR